MSEWHEAGRMSDLPAGGSRCVEVAGRKIALFNVEGRVFAIDDTCTHRGGPLSQGDVEGHQVTCPWHGGKFDLETGNVVGPPPQRPVAAYRVAVEGGTIKVEV